MDRRKLIKTGLLCAASTLSGFGNEKSNQKVEENSLEIIPKQTGIYEISVPMPFNYKTIDDLARLNKKYKKSQVVTLYNSIPSPMSDKYNLCFEINRGENENIKSMDDFIKYAKYAQNKGFKICYLMNSAKGLSEDDFKPFKQDFYKILDKLYKNGINNIKFANTQIASLINESGHKFELSASTICEYHTISQYKNLIENYPNIKVIDIAIDENQNFKFLKEMRKIFPNVKLELMLNEFCIKGCPAGNSHVTESKINIFNCPETINTLKGFFKTGRIYPWQIEYYSAINCNNFKYVSGERSNFKDYKPLEKYLNIIEYGIDKLTVSNFFVDLFQRFSFPKSNQNLQDAMRHFPDIKYFIKYGDKCAINCGVNCNYCDECAEKLEEFIG